MTITFLQPISHLSCVSYEFDAADGQHVVGSCDIDDTHNHSTTSRGDFPTSSEQAAIEAAIKAEKWVR